MRYIDAEALTDSMLEHYNELCEKYGDYDHYTTGYGDAIDAIENAPTADVAPKSEVTKTLSDIKWQIHEKAIYPHNAGIKPYISVREVDAIIEKEISHVKGGG